LSASGVLTVSGSMNNAGIVNLAAAQRLVPAGLLNTGIVNLAGGAVGGAGSMGNAAGGILRGDGSVAVSLTNDGGLIHANGANELLLSAFAGNLSGGELRIENGSSLRILASSPPISNQGSIVLKGPNATLSGNTLTNCGIIRGQGTITNQVNNTTGTIRAEEGQLTFSGTGHTNNGAIQAIEGATVAYSRGLSTNSGLIALEGGTFDNGNFALSNSGSILGRGALRTGGLNNFNALTLSDGNNSVSGAVTNKSGSKLFTYGAGSNVTAFFGLVTDEAGSELKINGGIVRFLGGHVLGGNYHSDPADNYFSSLTITSTGTLTGGGGDRFFINGPFTNAGAIDLNAGAAMSVQNGVGNLVQTGGALSLGAGATLAAGTLQISGGTISADGPTARITASLDYASPLASTFQGEIAGAGKTVTLDNPSATLTLTGHNTYTGDTTVNAGTLIAAAINNPGDTTVLDGGTLIVGSLVQHHLIIGGSKKMAGVNTAVPEPSALVLLGIVGISLLVAVGRRGRKE
jgi:fibronectin-binding autotransporter adhesin